MSPTYSLRGSEARKTPAAICPRWQIPDPCAKIMSTWILGTGKMAFRFRVFKHAEDRLPVACILALSALDFILYCTVSNPYLLGLYFFAMIVPKSQICAWNHDH